MKTIDTQLNARSLTAPGTWPERLQFVYRFASKQPFLSFILVSALVFGLYFGVIHPPVYVAETQFSIRGRDNASSANVFAGILPAGGGTGISESIAVREYIHSPQMLAALDETHDLRQHYSAFRIDPLNRIGRRASAEDLLSFYRSHVKVNLDREASILKVSVHGFSAEMSHAMAQSITAFSELYVNDLSTRIRVATLDDATATLSEAEEEVRSVRLALAAFRNRSGELDPAQRGAASVNALIQLEATITQLRGDLASQLAIRRPDAPQISELEARIAALETQAADQRRSLASSAEDDTLAELLEEFEGLVIQREYAETRLTAALTALDGARQLADQRERFVVPIVEPTLPTVATEPKRLARFCLSLVLAIIGYGIVNYAIAGIRDHDR